MTEDDTFRALKKATFEKMEEIFANIAGEHSHRAATQTNYNAWFKARVVAAEKNGWTVQEYQHENYRRLHG